MTFGVSSELVCLWVEAALLWVSVLSELSIGMLATSSESDVCRCRYLQDGGATALYVASERGHDAVVTALLASGASVNQATTGGVGC